MAGDTSINPFMPFTSWNMLQYGLACTFTMGLTTLWKFPYCIFMHSALYLVGYYTLLVLLVIPVYWVQVRLGQVYRRGLLTLLAHFFPAFKGVGLVLLCWAYIHCINHNVLLSQCLYYMIAGMQQPYPWAQLANKTSRIIEVKSNVVFHGRTPAEDYYYNAVIQRTESGVPWHLGLCMVAVSLLTYLPLVRGSRSLSKVLYVTVPLSVAILFSLMVTSLVTTPDVATALGSFFMSSSTIPIGEQESRDAGLAQSQLSSPRMWINALDVHIVSLGLLAGILPTLGAHIGRKKPAATISPWLILVPLCLPYVMTLTVAPLLQTLSPTHFAMLRRSLQPGVTMLFVSLPEAFSVAGIHPVWVVGFYLCLLLLALHYQVMLLLVVMENIIEFCPGRWLLWLRRPELLSAAICLPMLLLGLPQLAMEGITLQLALEQYLYSGLYIATPLVIPGLILAYKSINPFNMPIEKICLMCWFALGCVGIVIVEVYRDIHIRRPLLKDVWLPRWAHVIGHMASVAVLFVCVLAGLIHALWVSTGTFLQRVKKVVRPMEGDLRSMPGCFDVSGDKVNPQVAAQDVTSPINDDPKHVEMIMPLRNSAHEPAHV